MSNLDNVNSAFSAAVYKKLQKQISPLVEKITQLQEDTRLIETTPGPKGDKGIKGDQGIAGRDGERGLIGEQGLQGIQGIQGIQGEKGDTGDQGIQGDKGDTGQQGVKGEAGQQGIQGNPGKDGLTGKPGPQGIQGLKGDTGDKGDTGASGVDGKPGAQGIQGEAGPQGKDGVDGNDGKDAELPDIDKIIEPHFVKVKKEIDSYVIKSNNDFNNWKSTINNQISNNVGGGEVWLSRLNDVQQSTAKVDGQFLKYDASQKKWVGGSVDISSIVGGAPEALDTLNELAEALNDDENFATTITSSIAAKASQTDLDTHTADTTNPHSVTATQIGLGNVEDKSAATIIGEIVDSDIPSTITRDSELSAHTSLTNNPHSVTATQIGLGNVEDKSSADIRGEIVDGDIPSTIARDSELPTKSSLGLSNVTDESKATMFTSPSFTGTISSSGLLDFGHRTSNDIIIRAESNSHDITLMRAASDSDTVGVSLKYIGSGDGDENLFEIVTDGGGSLKIDNSGDVGINTAPVDGIDLAVGNIAATDTVTAKGYSLNANTFTVVSTTSTLAASTNGLTVILQNTGPINITLPTLAAGHVTTFISETNNAVTFVADTGITVNSFGGNDTTAGIFAQCQVIYKTTTVAFLGGNLV